MLMYYSSANGQMVPVDESGTITYTRANRIVEAQTRTLQPGAFALTAVEASAGYEDLHIFSRAEHPYEVKVVWSFDGATEDGEQILFEYAFDSLPKSIRVAAPFFKLRLINHHTEPQDITVKAFLN